MRSCNFTAFYISLYEKYINRKRHTWIAKRHYIVCVLDIIYFITLNSESTLESTQNCTFTSQTEIIYTCIFKNKKLYLIVPYFEVVTHVLRRINNNQRVSKAKFLRGSFRVKYVMKLIKLLEIKNFAGLV